MYNYIHIGNARPLCIFDILRRYLEYRGYNVKFVQNFTDIDDKIIRRANEEHVDFSEISERYIKEFWTDADGLNVRHATINPKATENIDAIIQIISTLIEKGYAYEAQGDVYFSTEKFKDYGKLSHQPLEDLEAGARIMVGEVKRFLGGAKAELSVVNGKAREEAEKLMERLKDELDVTGDAHIMSVSPVLAIHTGPGLLGIVANRAAPV